MSKMKLLILACFIGIVVSKRHSATWPFATTELPSATDTVNEIKRMLIDVERKMQDFCRAHSSRELLETYGAIHYRLTANLTGCREDCIEVRAGQRLVAVQVRDPHCEYIGLQILPDVVDTNNAYWHFENGEFTVFFSYHSGHTRCGRVISNTVRTLPKLDTNNDYPDIDVRFGDVNLEKALKSYKTEP